jgi:hypothetical protein
VKLEQYLNEEKWVKKKSGNQLISYFYGDIEVTKMFVGLWKGHDGDKKQFAWAIMVDKAMIPANFRTLAKAKKYVEGFGIM